MSIFRIFFHKPAVDELDEIAELLLDIKSDLAKLAARLNGGAR